jgi:hypothetical protein
MGKFSDDTIQLHGERVTTSFLWATRLEIADKPQRFDGTSHDALHRSLDAVDRIHSSNPRLAVTYADVLFDCIDVKDDRVTDRPGLEQVASAASICLLRALSHVDEGMSRHYTSTIPPNADFEGLLCRHTMSAIHALLVSTRDVGWTGRTINPVPRSMSYSRTPWTMLCAQGHR